MSSKNIIEIELDSRNGNILFDPLNRKLRGRVDFGTIERDGATRRAREWGNVVPGQIVGIDTAKGEGYVREPIHDDADLKAKVEKRFTLGPNVETFEKIDVEAWARAIARLVEGGHARLICGTLPEIKPIIEKPTATELLAAATYAALSPEQRDLADKTLAGFRR